MLSATKYINGHGDVVMGIAAMNDDSLYQRLQFIQFGEFFASRVLHVHAHYSSCRQTTILIWLRYTPV